MTNVINEKTLLPVSLVIVLIGGTTWLTTLHAEVRAQEKVLQEIKIKQDQYTDHMREVAERLGRLEGAAGLGEPKK